MEIMRKNPEMVFGLATGATMGGTEFTREVSLLSRDSIAENGGWL